MTIINYTSFIEKINETKKNNYDCKILLFYTGEIMSGEENIQIEDEESFYNIFGNLIYYIETQACNIEERESFKIIVDDLVFISSIKKLDSIDVDYLLFKEDVLKFVDKFRSKKITEEILKEQFYKTFKIQNYNYLLAQLNDRYKIVIQ
jgi:hypothetical protein